ncbi:hypothetical protein [Paracoccus sp. TOH]|uniref:Transposase n=1 Tax=Paracoccus simplex TaxID=2086346 RepID=A0ABV7RVM3_9RHOB|nr:hypothetical protein [Paracoccus sp. TOH]WJS86832.1 hypothetical protein NBE95_17385 [Paracoccus sp. TOH]
MANSESSPVVDPELDAALCELLAQTAREPISPRLHALAQRLEAALEAARLGQTGQRAHRKAGGEGDPADRGADRRRDGGNGTA